MKIFTLPQPNSHKIKSYNVLSLGDIQKYTDICFKSASRMQFWAARNGGVQMVFVKPNRSMFTGKFLVNSERFWLCCMTILFSM